MAIGVLVLIRLEDSIVDALMRTNLEPDINSIGYDEEDGSNAGDVDDTLADFASSCSPFGSDRSMVYGRNDQPKATIFR